MNATLRPRVEARIQIIHGAKAILGADPAALFGVSTKACSRPGRRV